MSLAAAPLPQPDPTLLPVATTAQIPLTAAYAALNVPSLPHGGFYLDPTTGVKIHKLTSQAFPPGAGSPGLSWGHAYAEGGDEVSLPYNGKRAIHLYQGDGWHTLIDFDPATGAVGNPRVLTGPLQPVADLGFAFSNNPATPNYAYIGAGDGAIRRFDWSTGLEVPGGGFPHMDATNWPTWLHQAEADSFFVWMRGGTGPTIVGYEPSTGTAKTYTNANLNEPRIDRAGRYIGISMTTPQNGIVLWDWLQNTITWSTDGTVPFAHIASLRRRWVGVDWNMSYPPDWTVWDPTVPNVTHFPGPGNATLVHGCGNWIQHPANLGDQWALLNHYGSLRPPEAYWLSPGGMVLVTPNGRRRLLGHAYNTTNNYTFLSFAKFSPDGRYVLFTSDMDGSPRSDVFLAELPTGSAPPPPPPPPSTKLWTGTVTATQDPTGRLVIAGVLT